MPRLSAVLAPLAIAALLTMSACNDDDDNGSGATATAPQATAAATSATTTAPETPAEGTDVPFAGARDPVEVTGTSQGVLAEVRTGEHSDFDRITFEFQGDTLPGYRVEYITAATTCGSGETVDVTGAAMLHVRFFPAAAHNEAGNPTGTATDLTPGLPAIQQATQICDFEGVVSWVVGVTAEADFRVTPLSDPPRLAVDVAHP